MKSLIFIAPQSIDGLMLDLIQSEEEEVAVVIRDLGDEGSMIGLIVYASRSKADNAGNGSVSPIAEG